MRRKEKPAIGSYYHVYNRGVNYQNIFFNQENWLFFLRLLRRYFTPDKVEIIAYCLMPNHYHLLVFLKTETFGEDVMQPFMVSYTKAINKQQGRVGALFQGPYQARRVGSDRYLIHLSRYIDLNPVTAGFVAKPEEWLYSSYQEYIGIRNGTLPQPQLILEQFGANPRNPNPRNPVFDKNRVSEVSERQAYADYVCSGNNDKSGLTASSAIPGGKI